MNEFENVTIMDRKALLAFNQISQRTFLRWRSLFTRLFLGLGGAVCLALAVLMAGVGGLDIFGWGQVLLCAAFGVFLLAQALFMARVNAYIGGRNVTASSGRRRYSFGEREIGMVASYQYRETCPYAKVRAVYETEGYYVLQTDRSRGLIFDKAGFTKGSAADFRAFIREKTGKEVKSISIKH